MSKIKKLIVHDRPHADEMCALIILNSWGDKIFHGIKTAIISFFGGGSILKSKQLPDDTLGIGVGGGMFDDHGPENKKRCAAVLVAQHIGKSFHYPLTKILVQTQRDDKTPSTRKNQIPKIITMMYKTGMEFDEIFSWYKTVFWAEHNHEEKVSNEPGFVLRTRQSWCNWLKRCREMPETTLESGFELIKADKGEVAAKAWKEVADKVIEKHQQLFLDAKREWKISGQSFMRNTVFGKIRIGHITSDSELMNSAARHCGVDLLIIQQGSGNVQIFANRSRNIDLTEVTAQIRIHEVRKGKGKYLPIDGKTHSLGMEGTHPEMLIWHLLEGSRSMLLNGSLTANCVEPTALTIEEIILIIKRTIDDDKPIFQTHLTSVEAAFQAA